LEGTLCEKLKAAKIWWRCHLDWKAEKAVKF